jgi:hypothetical protein
MDKARDTAQVGCKTRPEGGKAAGENAKGRSQLPLEVSGMAQIEMHAVGASAGWRNTKTLQGRGSRRGQSTLAKSGSESCVQGSNSCCGWRVGWTATEEQGVELNGRGDFGSSFVWW